MKIGIDVGGSHIGLGILNEENKLIYKNELDYIAYEEDMSKTVINTTIELIKNALKETSIEIKQINSIGIGIPGTVSNGIIIRAENLGIENLDITSAVKEKFNVPIFLQNDSKCAALAEKIFGSLKQYDDAIFLIIGTGVGGGVFLNGELLKPKRYSGFEIGHMVIKKDGERCNCGRRGCFEAYASIRRFKEKVMKEFKLPNSDGKEIKDFIAQNQNNEKLKNMINDYVDDLATGIANLINIFEPEAISIGGSFSYFEEILLKKVKNKIIEKQELFNKESMPKITVAQLKNDGGIIGAALI